ncbi:response regulator [Undibacterium sp. CY18W]|uniref:Response regulator n=1 Tax=Undibacterium hunanense TaxID=2762292 RepID=A0ABR6ZWC8_9BURK|nr:response regulator [Undibacterium hunanense]MBC3920192.1 response regulator [Undibacterium hunanense]
MKKALVVDDSMAELANIKTILSDAGYLVVTASSGKETLEKAKAEKPSIIFLDIVMPEMDGYEACRNLSQDPSTKDIPIVFVSSKSQKADRIWGQLQGAKGYVAKPYTADQIIDQLKIAA